MRNHHPITSQQDLAWRPSMAATYPDHQVLQLDYVAALLAQLRFPAVSLAIIIHPQSRGEQALRQKVPRRVNRIPCRSTRSIARERNP